MTEPAAFRWEPQGAIVTITFNRPEKRNGLDTRVMRELEELVHRARDDESIKVVILTGAGPAFCAGADLTLTRDATTDEERARARADLDRVPRLIGRIFDTLVHAELITIAAVNGPAVGGGWSLIAGFDHIVAAEGAEFWLPEVEIGMPFRGLANIGLTQRLGPGLAKEAMLLGRRFGARELATLRAVNQVCDPEDLAAEARAAAERYLALPWRAAMATRREINGTVYGPQYY